MERGSITGIDGNFKVTEELYQDRRKVEDDDAQVSKSILARKYSVPLTSQG